MNWAFLKKIDLIFINYEYCGKTMIFEQILICFILLFVV